MILFLIGFSIMRMSLLQLVINTINYKGTISVLPRPRGPCVTYSVNIMPILYLNTSLIQITCIYYIN